mgnify:CR=1 FL=1
MFSTTDGSCWQRACGGRWRPRDRRRFGPLVQVVVVVAVQLRALALAVEGVVGALAPRAAFSRPAWHSSSAVLL